MAGQRFNSGQVSEWGRPVRVRQFSATPESGKWVGGPFVAVANTARVSNEMYFTPIVFDQNATVVNTSIHVINAAASSFVRLGVYSENASGVPTTLIVDLGTVDTSSTGTKTVASTFSLTAGRYWFVAVSQPGSPTLRTGTPIITGYQTAVANVFALGSGIPVSVYRRDGISGALPSTTSPEFAAQYTATIFSVEIQ